MENLPIYSAIVLAAYTLNRLDVIDPFAMIFLSCRVGQSAIHLISTSQWAVFLRANFYVPQLLMQAYWIYSLYNIANESLQVAV
jgi:hypothetical protein